MATTNDVTGDELKSRGNSEAYQNGYDRIWGAKKKQKQDDCAGAQHANQLSDEDESKNQTPTP